MLIMAVAISEVCYFWAKWLQLCAWVKKLGNRKLHSIPGHPTGVWHVNDSIILSMRDRGNYAVANFLYMKPGNWLD